MEQILLLNAFSGEIYRNPNALEIYAHLLNTVHSRAVERATSDEIEGRDRGDASVLSMFHYFRGT